MSDELEIVSDGDGIAVFGPASSIEWFMDSAGVESRSIAPQRVSSLLSAGAGTVHAGSEVAAHAGRWVKLTEESARVFKTADLMKGPTGDVGRAVIMKNGKTSHILQIVRSSPSTILTNPAVLAGAAGIMAQIAMQQAMDEITDYLAVIDEKVDDVLRAQKDATLAEMIGVGLAIDEAMIIREHTGRVSEVTWSKVQSASMIISRTQSYALRQLDALAEKLDSKTKVSDLAQASKDAESTVEEWLAVLARCFQLMDGISVLELDRVLDVDQAAVDRHRLGIKAARQHRLSLISQTTVRLLDRISASADNANTKVLLNPFKSGAVVRSSNEVAADVIAFNSQLGIAREHRVIETKTWLAAAGEAGERALDTGAAGAGKARRLGLKAFDHARQASGRFSAEVAERAQELRDNRRTRPEEPDTAP